MNPSRLLIEVPLRPALGSRFQPTGFPDLGHAEFERPSADGPPTACLLVESAQSMANHLEAAAWESAANDQVALFAGLPYVRVLKGDSYVTSSRTESHRLASAFIKSSTLDGVSMVDVIRDRLGLVDDSPIDQRRVARAVFQLDPFALVHGVFFAEKRWPGQPRIARAVTGFIEASGVRRADSGGVKKDDVRHAIGEGAGSSEGYGTVPFSRTEWTATEIIASFGIDRKQIRSYGLGDTASALLEDIALWEIRSAIDDGIRLRTACDLVPLDPELRDVAGNLLPSVDDLEERIRHGIAGATDLLDGGGVLDTQWDGGAKKKRGEDA